MLREELDLINSCEKIGIIESFFSQRYSYMLSIDRKWKLPFIELFLLNVIHHVAVVTCFTLTCSKNKSLQITSFSF